MGGSEIGAVLAANPVGWARSQMAFTLAVHIILVPLGVSWAFMTLIANYKGLRHGDADALRLAQRWSRYMAVTFAVGAVTGTVLSFEFGLLWPRFMDRWGDAFGIPFAFEGLFFFTEAIFVAIYIFGWKRLKPWAHFWTGIPIVIAGIGGSASVIAANAWMNSPQGFVLDGSGEIVEVDPWKVIFNDAMPWMAAHMIVAAYVVGGFMVASVYAVAMLRGKTDRYHRLGFLIPFSVACAFMPVQMFVGDSLTRWVYNEQPIKFAVIEMVPETGSDVPETLFGRFEDGEVKGGIAIPGMASILSNPREGTATVIQGLDEVPADERPTDHQITVVHYAWDVMIGVATLLLLVALWFGFVWWRRRDLPQTRWFLRVASTCGVLAVIAMEAGWIVSEVGRQPWIVYEYQRVDEAVTANGGIWATFLGIALLYVAIAVGLVKVLRTMSRRFEEQDAAIALVGAGGAVADGADAAGVVADGAPYAPRPERHHGGLGRFRRLGAGARARGADAVEEPGEGTEDARPADEEAGS